MKGVLFLAIQTVAQARDFESLSPVWQTLWRHKARQWTDEDAEQNYTERAAHLAEFGQMIAVALGALRTPTDKEYHLHVKSILHQDEAQLLRQMGEVLSSPTLKAYRCCAHNGKRYHFPYVCRRLLAQGLPLPQTWQLRGRRPWQVEGVSDTMDDWVFGDFKHATPLRLLAMCLGIKEAEAPDWLSTDELHRLYYDVGDMNAILAHTQRQVIVNAQVYLRLRGHAVLSSDQITEADAE